MTIVMSTTAPDLDAAVDPRFGRAAFFLAVDPGSLAWQAHPNTAANASGGAGTQAAQFVAGLRAEAVISGAFGPNAFQALEAAGIAMFLCGHAETARQAVEDYRAGRLERAALPSRTGRHG
jgi:predicted Fe-Mo cluster-binding NifX family protein